LSYAETQMEGFMKTQTKAKTQETVCHECGMQKGQWSGNQGKGIEKGGMYFCCKGCADGTGCMCPTSP
jgi:hypothetical protein